MYVVQSCRNGNWVDEKECDTMLYVYDKYFQAVDHSIYTHRIIEREDGVETVIHSED